MNISIDTLFDRLIGYKSSLCLLFLKIQLIKCIYMNGIKVCGFITVSVILSIILVSYVVVLKLILLRYTSIYLSIFCGLIYHYLYILTFVCYLRSVFSKPGYVNENKLLDKFFDSESLDYCFKCEFDKPIRGLHSFVKIYLSFFSSSLQNLW